MSDEARVPYLFLCWAGVHDETKTELSTFSEDEGVTKVYRKSCVRCQKDMGIEIETTSSGSIGPEIWTVS